MSTHAVVVGVGVVVGGGVKRCGADPCLARRVFPGMLAVMGGR